MEYLTPEGQTAETLWIAKEQLWKRYPLTTEARSTEPGTIHGLVADIWATAATATTATTEMTKMTFIQMLLLIPK
jgi:hypothetical protein